MKTPKRKLICPNCGEEIMVEIPQSLHSSDPVFHCPSGCTLHDARYFLHGEIPELYKFTRWKRKNREARLRHALRKKDGIIDYAANVVQRMENEASDEYEHQRRLRLSLAATWTLNNFQRGYINASGTYGQDIEGS